MEDEQIIYVVFKIFRQDESGILLGVEGEYAYKTKEEAENSLKGKNLNWTETKMVDTPQGAQVPILFHGFFAIQPVVLK